MQNPLIESVQDHITKYFSENLPEVNVYHNLFHTKAVVDEVNVIAKAENMKDEDLEILNVAAWFHDIGYVQKCVGHEEISIGYARKFLEQQNLSPDKINTVLNCILATKVPQSPKNKLEEILCDADLHHLGTKKFEEFGDMLRLEIEKRTGKVFSDVEWLEKSVNFYNQHKFFTDYAKTEYETQKQLNLMKLEKRLKKARKKYDQHELAEKKLELQEQKFQEKIKSEKKADRGIETMFRNVMRTHVEFSGMADSKANIMISVNTLIITLLVSILIRKLDSNPHLIIPTALLVTTSLITLVYAILVTRPKVSSGTFTIEDIKSKKTNLLFFGNFYKMSINDFSWGMKEMMNDKDYLYDSMIKDFYYLGQVLGLKYKHLRLCYTIFMYGMIISVIAFVIAFITYPATDLGPLIE